MPILQMQKLRLYKEKEAELGSELVPASGLAHTPLERGCAEWTIRKQLMGHS